MDEDFRISQQLLDSDVESHSDLQREQARIAGEQIAPGLTLEQHFAPDTESFRELEVWRVERADGSETLDVWICSVPRGVVFRAGTSEVVGEIVDGNPHPPLDLVRAALGSAHAEHLLLGRWARRADLTARAHDVPDEPPPGDPIEEPVEVGALVFAKWGKRWWPAQVVSVSDDGYRVHYDGWESSWDEYVTVERLRRAPAKLAVQEGDAVQAEYRGKWYAARVLAVRSDGRVRITYDGWDSSWDEDVVPARLRKLTDSPS